MGDKVGRNNKLGMTDILCLAIWIVHDSAEARTVGLSSVLFSIALSAVEGATVKAHWRRMVKAMKRYISRAGPLASGVRSVLSKSAYEFSPSMPFFSQ